MRLSLVLAVASMVSGGLAQTPPAASGHHMVITVERLENGLWKRVDPDLVFERNDRVRFHYRADFAGYLYVINRSTSGKYEQLFPRAETGRDNRIESGKDYTIPQTDAVFRIAGPGGHELIYWLASPVELSKDAVPALPPISKPQPGDFLPRCDDAIFRARGDCVDSSAGPKSIPEGEPLPQGLSNSGAATPRDLLFVRREKTTVVATPGPLAGPIIYEFRLAHK